MDIEDYASRVRPAGVFRFEFFLLPHRINIRPSDSKEVITNQKYKSIIYERVDLARKGETKTIISKMDTGWLVLGDNQNIPGYCVFLSDPVVDNIHLLEINSRAKFMTEMTIAGEALQKAVNARLINYSILGNADVGLHVHIHPRYEWEDKNSRRKTLLSIIGKILSR